MTANIEMRFESRDFYEFVRRSSHLDTQYKSVAGYLSLRKPTSPLPTLELDEDSFWLAYSNWTTFIEYSLGAYASINADKVATVYTYSTGQSPSANRSRGEQHLKLGWHNAVFFGVVGRRAVLETIRRALIGGAGVPEDVIQSVAVDGSKKLQIHCGDSPDYIAFDRMGQASYHLEHGSVWCPYEENVWYTNAKWRGPA